MKKFLPLWGLLGAALVAMPAAAQVTTVPQPGVTSGYVPKQTFSAVWIGLAPAASATDVVCISGSASRRIQLHSMKWSGSAGTTLSLPITILRRIILDTGGTAATTTANPANTISRRDPAGAAPTATLISYTANPTINDTTPTYIDSAQVAISLTTMATTSIPVTFDWAKDVENLIQPPIIPSGSTAMQICANFNATTLATGVLTGSITWTEE